MHGWGTLMRVYVLVCVTEDQGQCQAPCQTSVLLFRPKPDPRLLHWANEHKQKTEEKNRGEHECVCECVCMCAYVSLQTGRKRENEDRGNGGR